MSDADRKAEQGRVILETPYEDEFWIFGFGSLMWRPGLKAIKRAPASLHGYERKFEIWSRVGRGTYEKPGLGCCLVNGLGSCRGIAYSLNMETLKEDLEYLWSREMGSGVYVPTWVDIDLDEGIQKVALAFIIREGHEQYAGPMSVADMARIIGEAEGENGKCRDYLSRTLAEMAKLGERDPLLEEVMSLIEAGEKLMS